MSDAATPSTPDAPALNIGVLLYHEVSELESISTYSVLKTAELILDDAERLRVFTVAKARNSVQTSGGLTITPLYAFASVPDTQVLVVPGGSGVDKVMRDKTVMNYLASVGASQTILASVSSGALLIGKTGFLRDQIATTHPALLERLEDYEILRVSQDRLVKNERVWCAGAGLAGVDLGLELIRHFFGEDLVTRVAERLAIETVQPALF